MKIKELRYGAPKTGKTKNVAESYPGPVLLVNTDPQGWQSITSRQVLKIALDKELDKELDKDIVYLAEFAEHLPEIGIGVYKSTITDNCINIFHLLNRLTSNNPFATIILDSWTTLDDVIMDFLITMAPAKSGKKVAEIQHYKMLKDKKSEILKYLLGLDCNLVVIAHEELSKNDITGELSIVPFGTGQFQNVMGLFFSQVFHAIVEVNKTENRYVVETQPVGFTKGVGSRGLKLETIVGARYESIYAS